MDPDIKIGIIQLTSNDNLQDNCNQLDYYFKQCLKDGANFILSPEVLSLVLLAVTAHSSPHEFHHLKIRLIYVM